MFKTLSVRVIMLRSTFQVLFYVKRQSEKYGQVSIMVRYHDQRYDVVVQLQTLRSRLTLGCQG